ncbi:MAG: T9SS type A sorting domain-containing protein [Melioribacteraceae bacterium]
MILHLRVRLFFLILFFTNICYSQWTKINPPPFPPNPDLMILAIEVNGNNIFVISNQTGIYLSSDYGANWNSISLNVYNVNSFLKPGTKKFKLHWSSLATTDNGNSWINLTIPRNNSIGVHDMKITSISDFDVCGDKIFLASNIGLLQYKQAIFDYSIINNQPVSSIAVNDSYLFISAPDGIYRSLDCGNTFQKVLNLDYYLKLATFNNFVIGCYYPNGAIWISYDNGITWTQKFLNVTNIIDISVNDKYLFFATKDNIWQAQIDNLLTDVKDEYLPQEYLLSQNYPNPFNPITTINYQIPKQSKVTLKVIDMLGREIETLVNGEKPFGSYSVKFDGSKLSSGIYFYQLITNEKVITKKFVLMK